MKQVTYTLTENTPLAPGVYRMALAGDTGAITAPGQFVNLALDGLFLRRPISVCDWDEKSLTLIYQWPPARTRRCSSAGAWACRRCTAWPSG